MALEDDLARIAALAGGGDRVAGVLAAEPSGGQRLYLCAFATEPVTWLVVEEDGGQVTSRELVRETASIVALCELAEDNAGGGELEELRSQLVTLRLTEAPEGIDQAEEAALELERTIGTPPRVASPAYLDAVGIATRALEAALGGVGPSPFAEAMKQAVGAVDEFARDVETGYRIPLG